jgi:hypothetical protein
MGAIPDRVVYCEPECLEAMPEGETEILHPGFPVRAVQDEFLLSVPGKYSFLYFSQQDYDYAIRELSAEHINEILAKRRETWSPYAAGYSIAWLRGELRKCLSLTALSSKQSDRPGTVELLNQNFEHTIRRLVNLEGAPPLGVLTPPEVFEIALVEETRIGLELKDLAITDGPKLAKRRMQRVGIIANMMADFGDKSYTDTPPPVVRRRGINVPSLPVDIRSDLEQEDEFPIDWSEGTVIPWPQNDLERLRERCSRERSGSIRILYLDAEEYESVVAAATVAQLEREFSGRLAAGVEDKTGEHINGLIVAQLVYIWGLRDLFSEMGRAGIVSDLEPLIHEDISQLMGSLQVQPCWLPVNGADEGDALGSLIAKERQIQQSAEFFAKLDHDTGWIEVREDYEGLLNVGSKLKELIDAHR